MENMHNLHPEAREEDIERALKAAIDVMLEDSPGEAAIDLCESALSRLATPKPEGQDKAEAIEELIDKLADYDSDLWAWEISDLDGKEIIYPDGEKIRAKIEAIFSMEPAAPEPRPAEEPVIRPGHALGCKCPLCIESAPVPRQKE